MKSFKQSYGEAIDTGEYGNLFHPSKKALYNTPQDVEKMFPNLGPEAQRYIETITGDAYKKAVERLQSYTGKNPGTFSLPALMQTVMGALQKVEQIQSGHSEELEKLAVDIVLNLPEFKAFKKWRDSGKLKFDVKLIDANLDNAIVAAEQEGEEEKANDEELTPYETVDFNVAQTLQDASDAVLKRKFANMMTQGNATNKLYLFQMASEQLNQIDPSLTKLYGVLSSIVQTSYYAMPVINFTVNVKFSAVGSEEVVPDEDGYIIRAKSKYFPYLIHEIVKGCWDLLSIDVVSNAELGNETLDDELMDIMTGPQLYTNMSKLIPSKDIELLPYVYRLLLKKDINTTREVLSGGGRAQNIINTLIQQAKTMQGEYDQASDEKPWQDSEEGEPEQ
jgi:hypothetical protein